MNWAVCCFLLNSFLCCFCFTKAALLGVSPIIMVRYILQWSFQHERPHKMISRNVNSPLQFTINSFEEVISAGLVFIADSEIAVIAGSLSLLFVSPLSWRCNIFTLVYISMILSNYLFWMLNILHRHILNDHDYCMYYPQVDQQYVVRKILSSIEYLLNNMIITAVRVRYPTRQKRRAAEEYRTKTWNKQVKMQYLQLFIYSC